MITPVTMSWTQFSSPIFEQPLATTVMIRAPTRLPRTVPCPPVEARAADDDGGDDVELHADGGRRVAHAEVGELQHAGDGEERGGEDVDRAAWCARRARRTGGRSARWSRWRRCAGRSACSAASPETSTASTSISHTPGVSSQSVLGVDRLEQAVEEPAAHGVDHRVVGQPLRRAAEQRHHAERDDERGELQAGDERAVDDADAACRRAMPPSAASSGGDAADDVALPRDGVRRR